MASLNWGLSITKTNALKKDDAAHSRNFVTKNTAFLFAFFSLYHTISHKH